MYLVRIASVVSGLALCALSSAGCSGSVDSAAQGEDVGVGLEQALTATKVAQFSTTSSSNVTISLTNCQVTGVTSETNSEASLFTLKPSGVTATRIDSAIAANQATIALDVTLSGAKSSNASGSATVAVTAYHIPQAGSPITTVYSATGVPLTATGSGVFADTVPFSIPVPSTIPYQPGDSFTVEYKATLNGGCDPLIFSQVAEGINPTIPTFTYTY